MKRRSSSVLLLCCVPLMAGCSTGRQRVQEGIVYANPGHRTLHLSLFLPDGPRDKARPCVLLMHGGAWVGGSRHQLRWYGRHLAAEGYVAASISYRKLPRHRFRDSVQDAKTAVCWLKEHAADYGIDPNRIIAFGNSAGGYLAGMLAATSGNPAFEDAEVVSCSTRVSAAVSLYGALDLAVYKSPHTWIRVGGVARRLVTRYVSDDVPTGTDAHAFASPITYFDANTAPMLFIQGEKDNLVPAEVAARAHETLQKCGATSRIVSVPGRGHAFDFIYRGLRESIFADILQFLNDTGNAPAT